MVQGAIRTRLRFSKEVRLTAYGRAHRDDGLRANGNGPGKTDEPLSKAATEAVEAADLLIRIKIVITEANLRLSWAMRVSVLSAFVLFLQDLGKGLWQAPTNVYTVSTGLIIVGATAFWVWWGRSAREVRTLVRRLDRLTSGTAPRG